MIRAIEIFWVVFALLWVPTGGASAQLRRDTSAVSDQEFLRLLQRSEQLNEEQKKRAQRTQNPRILARLGEDEDPGVRFYVAFNPFTPIEVLEKLASDVNPTVRWGVARNDRFLFRLDSTLVADLDDQSGTVDLSRAFGERAVTLAPDARVTVDRPGRRWVVEDRYSSFTIILRRTGLKVYSMPLSRETLTALSKDYAEIVRVGLANNPSTEAWVLRDLSEDASVTVRRHTAANENAEPVVLEIMSRDSARPVRLEVAGNPSTPLHVLESMSVDVDEGIRERVAANPGSSPAIMLGMIFDTNDLVRESVARHAATPASGLGKLAEDPVVAVRQAVVANRHTLPEALRRLSFDADPDIKKQARTRLAAILKDQIALDRER